MDILSMKIPLMNLQQDCLQKQHPEKGRHNKTLGIKIVRHLLHVLHNRYNTTYFESIHRIEYEILQGKRVQSRTYANAVGYPVNKE